MSRAYRLNDSRYGFHAQGRHLDSGKIKSVIASLHQANGFFPPDRDTSHRLIPLRSPSSPVGFRDRKYYLTYRTDEEIGPSGYFNIVSPLVAWKPFAEKWPWSRIREILRSNPDLHHFGLTVNLRKEVHARIKGTKVSYVLTCLLTPWQIQSDRIFNWTISIFIAPVKEWKEGVTPADDPDLIRQISSVAQKWAALAGLSHLLRTEEDPEGSGLPVWRITPGKPVNYTGPYLMLDCWSELEHGLEPEFMIPGDRSAILSLKPNIQLTMTDLETALSACEAALQPFFGDDPAPEEISFTVLDPEIPEFKKLVEPLFGSPWLQEMGGFAQPGYVPRVEASIPDWTIQPVAYFKILGSWRTIDLLKEPEGWRFLVTGKYTKDPLKHRHIRDELARKAGMTSDTLWEPQEAGGGWLGVPG